MTPNSRGVVAVRNGRPGRSRWPGLGPLSSTALMPAVGDPNHFRSGRKIAIAAYLPDVPFTVAPGF